MSWLGDVVSSVSHAFGGGKTSAPPPAAPAQQPKKPVVDQAKLDAARKAAEQAALLRKQLAEQKAKADAELKAAKTAQDKAVAQNKVSKLQTQIIGAEKTINVYDLLQGKPPTYAVPGSTLDHSMYDEKRGDLTAYANGSKPIATTIETEKVGDASQNCLDLAQQYIEGLTPEMLKQGNQELVFLKDPKDPKADGHVLVRNKAGGAVFDPSDIDPNTGAARQYTNLEDFTSKHPDLSQEVGRLDANTAKNVFKETDPAKRDAMLDQAGASQLKNLTFARTDDGGNGGAGPPSGAFKDKGFLDTTTEPDKEKDADWKRAYANAQLIYDGVNPGFAWDGTDEDKIFKGVEGVNTPRDKWLTEMAYKDIANKNDKWGDEADMMKAVPGEWDSDSGHQKKWQGHLDRIGAQTTQAPVYVEDEKYRDPNQTNFTLWPASQAERDKAHDIADKLHGASNRNEVKEALDGITDKRQMALVEQEFGHIAGTDWTRGNDSLESYLEHQWGENGTQNGMDGGKSGFYDEMKKTIDKKRTTETPWKKPSDYPDPSKHSGNADDSTAAAKGNKDAAAADADTDKDKAGPGSADAPGPKSKDNTATSPTVGKYYDVKSGDTLSGIAKKAGYKGDPLEVAYAIAYLNSQGKKDVTPHLIRENKDSFYLPSQEQVDAVLDSANLSTKKGLSAKLNVEKKGDKEIPKPLDLTGPAKTSGKAEPSGDKYSDALAAGAKDKSSPVTVTKNDDGSFTLKSSYQADGEAFEGETKVVVKNGALVIADPKDDLGPFEELFKAVIADANNAVTTADGKKDDDEEPESGQGSDA